MTNTLEQLAIEVGAELKNRQWKLVTAESCTGGGLAYWLTSVPGSSEWYERGFVTYSNLAKKQCLGVKAETLDQFGAVSEHTAREMAEGALQSSNANISIAITGIAGPDGGTAEKPVGTVWIAYSGIHTNTQAIQYFFSGNRQAIREKSIQTVLEYLKKGLK